MQTLPCYNPSHIKGVFVWEYSGIRIYLEYILAILLLGAEKPEWKSKYSGIGRAAKRTLTCIIPIILISD